MSKKLYTHTARLPYGPNGGAPYYHVKVRLATKAVKIKANVLHALKSDPGTGVGCFFSNAATDPINAAALEHPALLAWFTHETVHIIEKKHKSGPLQGTPSHAVKYRHPYGKLIDGNDDGSLKKLVKQDPGLVDRTYTLRPPRTRRGDHSRTTHATVPNPTRSSSKPVIHRGALARAVKAGLVSKPVARQMEEVAAATTMVPAAII